MQQQQQGGPKQTVVNVTARFLNPDNQRLMPPRHMVITFHETTNKLLSGPHTVDLQFKKDKMEPYPALQMNHLVGVYEWPKGLVRAVITFDHGDRPFLDLKAKQNYREIYLQFRNMNYTNLYTQTAHMTVEGRPGALTTHHPDWKGDTSFHFGDQLMLYNQTTRKWEVPYMDKWVTAEKKWQESLSHVICP
ncbi:hypothetical protein M011DRAFT_514880 [Sporormia fimetaria CBS 119925]|uniref:Uncharacterized protein n=1 Tax=Sporormia fimetaria CBS 119925 TaxID=1340428 RepID=A0A6A6UV54_9PLEO|nr:hypothetical protein M011DRAFT_514880 [Sporormia fimetaria CBS 119925]